MLVARSLLHERVHLVERDHHLDERERRRITAGGATIWSRSFGGAGDDRLFALAVGPEDRIAITGFFQGEIDFGGGPLDAGAVQASFVAVLDASGAHVWSKSFPGGDRARGTGIGFDAAGDVFVSAVCDAPIDFGGGALAGSTPDLCVAKLDPAGHYLYGRRFAAGSVGAIPYALAVDPAGRALVGGTAYGALDLGGGASLAPGGFAIALDPSGNVAWSKAVGVTPTSIAADASGRFYLTGEGNTLAPFGGPAGSSTSGTWVVRLDGAGAYQFGKVFAGQVTPGGVAAGPQGALMAAGSFGMLGDFGGVTLTGAGGARGYLASLDPSGKTAFAEGFGDALGAASGDAVAVSAAGEIAMAGVITGTIDLGGGPLAGPSLYAMKRDPEGGARWARAWANDGADLAAKVATSAAGDVVIATSFRGAIDLGAGALASNGGADVLVARLAR